MLGKQTMPALKAGLVINQFMLNIRLEKSNKMNISKHGANTAPQPFKPFYLSKKDVVKKTTLSNSAIDRLEAKGQFPKRITLSRNKVMWVYTEIHNWCVLVNELKEYPQEGYYTDQV